MTGKFVNKTVVIRALKKSNYEFLVLWNVYGECENISMMSGHTGAIMEMHFTPDGSNLFTASTDHTLGLWDIVTGQRIKKFKGHTTFVNSVQGIF